MTGEEFRVVVMAARKAAERESSRCILGVGPDGLSNKAVEAAATTALELLREYESDRFVSEWVKSIENDHQEVKRFMMLCL